MFPMLSSAETAVFLESYRLILCNGTSLKCATCETKDGKNLLTSVTDVLAYRGQIPVAARSKARICGHSLVGIAVSNTAEGMSVCLFVVSVVCCQAKVSAADRSFIQRGPTAFGVSERDREASIMMRPWPTGAAVPGRSGIPHLDKNNIKSNHKLTRVFTCSS